MNLLHRTSSANIQTDLDYQVMKKHFGSNCHPQSYPIGVNRSASDYPNNHVAHDDVYASSTLNVYNHSQPANTPYSNYSNVGYSYMGSHIYSNIYPEEDHENYYNTWDEVNPTSVESYDSTQSSQSLVPQANGSRPLQQPQVLNMLYPPQQPAGLPSTTSNPSLLSQQLVSPTMDQQRYIPSGVQSTPLSLCYIKVKQDDLGYIAYNQYPDITALVNANSNIVVPMVESQFVDKTICTVCGKKITRDMLRHLRTHRPYSRFNCKFPKSQCKHKLGKFNRPYDFKKHLLNRHFKFDNPNVKKYHNLSDKLNHWGTCPCGLRFLSNDWLDDHILTKNTEKRCPLIED